MQGRRAAAIWLPVLGLSALVLVGLSVPAAVADEAKFILENFDDIVTASDRGFDDFAGNMGDLNSPGHYGTGDLLCPGPTGCLLRFNWDFGVSSDGFTGQFFALMGLTDTLWTQDGETAEKIYFPEHVLDLDAVDGPIAEPGGPRRLNHLCAELGYAGQKDLLLRMELQDPSGGLRYTRVPIPGKTGTTRVCWDFRLPGGYFTGTKDLDIHAAKVAALVIERRHVADGVDNPTTGSLDIHGVWFNADRGDTEPVDEAALLDLLARRTYSYFDRWLSRKAESLGIPQDRSTFADLLTVGGVGFSLPAQVIAAERQWLSREEAAQRVLDTLRILDQPSAFGPEAKGRLGHRGFFYHFLGPDGRRKLNFDYAETPVDERLNTVELSSVDTALAVLGALVAQSYFDRNTASENEIRTRAQAIYNRVDWTFFLNTTKQRFYLGWKPKENRSEAPEAGGVYQALDATGQGAFSGTPQAPATWDFYTDEDLIIALLAIGSTSHPVSPGVWCAIERPDPVAGVIRTWPGSLFTYQFLHAFLDTANLDLPACPGKAPDNWYANSINAINAAIEYATANPDDWPTYGPNAWGLSASEGPSDRYFAYGAPPLALASPPKEDGTITYYGMVSAVSYGAKLRQDVVNVVREAWSRDHWHPFSGLPDAFHDEIAAVAADDPGPFTYRAEGAWVSRALFAIDQGPMLLHLENARSGLIHRLLAANPNIQRAIERLQSTEDPSCPSAGSQDLVLEGEDGVGNGEIRQRSAASRQLDVWLHAGESRTLSFQSPGCGTLEAQLRYSNDNLNTVSGESVTVKLDGQVIGEFTAEDTGDGGFGWNSFVTSPWFGPIEVTEGPHQLSVHLSGGDGYGWELDRIEVKITGDEPLVPPPTATVCEFHHAGLDQYYYSANPNECALWGSNPSIAGVSTHLTIPAYAGSNYPGLANPVCRFYGVHYPGESTTQPGHPNSHFFTLNTPGTNDECDVLRSLYQQNCGTFPNGYCNAANWHLEFASAFAMIPRSGQSCPAGTIPVYRAYNRGFPNRDSNHRFTTDLSEYNTILSYGWEGEGIVFCAPGG